MPNVSVENEVHSLICAGNIYKTWYMHEESREKYRKALELTENESMKAALLRELCKPDCQPGNCRCGCCL